MTYVVREQVLDVLRRSNAAEHVIKAVELLPWFTQEPIAEVDATNGISQDERMRRRRAAYLAGGIDPEDFPQRP